MSLDDAPPIAGATARPLFIDNRDGNTLARAITTHLAALRREDRIPAELCVASCYFNPQGLELIAGEARHVPRIRLLLGAEPFRAPHPLPPIERQEIHLICWMAIVNEERDGVA